MNRFRRTACALLLVTLGLAGCNHRLPFDVSLRETAMAANEAHRDTLDRRGFVERLGELGGGVVMLGEVEQPFLSVDGRRVQVNGAELQVYEYPDAESALADARRMALDVRTVTTDDARVAAVPVAAHFFLHGRLIVLYSGNDPEVLSLLGELLGQPLAPA